MDIGSGQLGVHRARPRGAGGRPAGGHIQNVVHAALFLVATLAASAGLFLMLSAEFVAWTVVLVYIGAVMVLFLFGIMITRAPGSRRGPRQPPSGGPRSWRSPLFAVLSYTRSAPSTTVEIQDVGVPTPVTETLGVSLLGRFVLPFEVVGFILLAALIGGITLARRDLTPRKRKKGDRSDRSSTSSSCCSAALFSIGTYGCWSGATP
jgi:NADH-quinone oxidoreductase subunit J